MQITIATPTDHADLTRLVLAFRDFFGYTTPTDAEYATALAKLLNVPDCEFHLARDDQGTPLGYVSLRTRFSAWANGLEGDLEDVFVSNAARGQGVGQALVRFARERAAALGCRWLYVCTNEHNQAALALYERLGFDTRRSAWEGGRQLQLIHTFPGPDGLNTP